MPKFPFPFKCLFVPLFSCRAPLLPPGLTLHTFFISQTSRLHLLRKCCLFHSFLAARSLSPFPLDSLHPVSFMHLTPKLPFPSKSSLFLLLLLLLSLFPPPISPLPLRSLFPACLGFSFPSNAVYFPYVPYMSLMPKFTFPSSVVYFPSFIAPRTLPLSPCSSYASYAYAFSPQVLFNPAPPHFFLPRTLSLPLFAPLSTLPLLSHKPKPPPSPSNVVYPPPPFPMLTRDRRSPLQPFRRVSLLRLPWAFPFSLLIALICPRHR